MDLNLFRWLMDYHSRVNLEACLPHFNRGRIQVRGRPLEEGLDENELYKGLLIVANGDTLAARLREDQVILDEPADWVKTSTSEEFAQYLSQQRNGDGAYIFDSVNRRLTKVSEINNNPSTLPQELDLYQMIPSDFVSDDGRVDLKNIGTKTRLAIKIPHAYPNTHTYQIKRSAYTPLGLGKVTHFSTQGLVEEFFFRCLPGEGLTAPAVKSVYRRYGRNQDNRLVRKIEEISSLPPTYSPGKAT